MKKILEELTIEMNRVNPQGFARFNKGITLNETDKLLRGFPMPQKEFSEVLELLQWRNGGLECAGGGFEVVMMPGYMLESLSEIINHYNITKYISDLGKNLMPFISDFSDGTCFYDIQDKCIVKSFPDGVDIVRYKSMSDFLDTICRCYKENIYFINEDDCLDCDYDKAEEIFSSIVVH